MDDVIRLTDRTQLLDYLWHCQDEKGYIGDADVAAAAEALGLSLIEIEGVVSFYHFFHRQPAGKHVIYLNNSILSELNGYGEVRAALEAATGARWGGVDPTGQFGIYDTSCIGLSDQEPAALINFQPFTRLTPQKAKAIIWQMRRGVSPATLADAVPDNVRYTPPPERAMLLRPVELGQTLSRLREWTPERALEEIERSGLRGMGGAFFPVGRKWALCRQQEAEPRYVVCNADEGEPGTFKDRVLLNRYPEIVIEGMILAGYCIGAAEGILYLRAEYRWLLPHLEATLRRYREAGWLGEGLPVREPFDFDIRIQLGAGAYVCGEETALLHSLEGERGEPRVRTYFPVERGFRQQPTIVNNVETFAAAARIVELGADHFRALGTRTSPGTRLLSVAGDCRRPGIYEVEWGMTLGQLLYLCEAVDPRYVQVSGPSGQAVNARFHNRRFDLEDLRCGGAVTIFNEQRDLLQVLRNFTEFFKHESCGVCTPCRAGNFIFSRKLDKLAKGLGAPEDRADVLNWSRIMEKASRCGLGRSATTALLSAMEQFPDYFACYFGQAGDCEKRPFDLNSATEDYRHTVNL